MSPPLLDRIADAEKRSLIQQSAEKLKDFQFVLGVILFGSYARGKATPISDIDLCILDDLKFQKEERMAALDFSSTTLSISLFSELPLYVQFEALTEGIVLWLKNREWFLELKERTILEYMDTRYLWDEPGAIERWLTGKKQIE